MGKAVLKSPLVAVLILLLAVSIFIGYQYMWGFLASQVKPPQPDFEISADPEQVAVHSWEGSSNTSVITVRSIGGFSGRVTLEVGYTFLFGDVRLILSSSEVTLQADDRAYCLLTVYTLTPIKPGQYHVDVVGKSGSIEHSVRITVTVTY